MLDVTRRHDESSIGQPRDALERIRSTAGHILLPRSVRNVGPVKQGNPATEFPGHDGQEGKEEEMTTETQRKTSAWNIDPGHTIAEFAVKHLMLTTVKGRFRDLHGTLHLDEANLEDSWIEVRIAVASVDTNLEARDNDLRSHHFFSADEFPYITFRSTKVERLDEERFRLTGDLAIRDVTKEVVLDGEYGGQIDDPYGYKRAGFTATTQINRRDFGMRFNQIIEGGGVAVGDKVKITLHVEATLQKGEDQ
jgi:polyisoprenoid-binding protein YceI